MEAYEVIQLPLNDEERDFIESKLESEMRSPFRYVAVISFNIVLIILVCYGFGILSFDTAMACGSFPVIIGGYSIYLHFESKKQIDYLHSMLDSGVKRAVKGYITKKGKLKIGKRNTGSRKIRFILTFGRYCDVVVTPDVYRQVDIGDEVFVPFKLTEEFSSDHVEVLSKGNENGINVESLSREENDFYDLLAKADKKVEKIDDAKVKEMPFEMGDKKKLIKVYARFMRGIIIGIILGVITIPIVVGFVILPICLGLLVLAVVWFIFDFQMNKKFLCMRTLHAVVERRGKVIIELEAGQTFLPYRKVFERSEIDQYDLSSPVIAHIAPFSKRVFDLTFKQKA